MSRVRVLHGPRSMVVPLAFRGVRPVWRLLRWRGVTLFGLRASRWVRYYAPVVASRPPGLAGFSACGGMVDAPD